MKSPEHQNFRTPVSRTTVAMVVACAISLVGAVSRSRSAPSTVGPKREGVLSHKKYGKPAAAELRKTLTPIQYEITQNAGTEPPFHNPFWDNHQPGLYVDVATGEPLFSSTDKFDSGTGWPSEIRKTRPCVVISVKALNE